MTEQGYKEMTLALKHSEIPLDMQKEFQRLLDKAFVENEKSCTSATGKVK